MQTQEETPEQTSEEMMRELIASSGAHSEEIALRLIEKGILSREPEGNWIVYSPKDIMLFIPTIKEVIGLYFTSRKYADAYVNEKYKKSHKEVRIFRLCNGNC